MVKESLATAFSHAEALLAVTPSDGSFYIILVNIQWINTLRKKRKLEKIQD